MEGLFVSCGNNSVRVPGATKHQYHFLPSSTLHLRNSSVGVRICINTVKRSTSPSYVAGASVGESKVGHFENTLPSKEILELWRRADAVCFDVDSTVCVDEGIDELAEFCGAGKAVAEWTSRAMGGSVTFEEALAARLSLLKPSLSQLQNFLEQHPSSSGEFLGFDKNEPTSRSEGKATAVQQIRKAHGYNALAMVGDGAIDLEARRPGGADLFICFAGVQLREAVAAKADWLVFNFEGLINSLE